MEAGIGAPRADSIPGSDKSATRYEVRTGHSTESANVGRTEVRSPAEVRAATEVRATAKVRPPTKVSAAATTTTAVVLGVRQGRCGRGGEPEKKRACHSAKTSHNRAFHGSCLRREHHLMPRGFLFTKLDLRWPHRFKLQPAICQEACFERGCGGLSGCITGERSHG
jgi:hypothetical protein